MTAAQSKDKNFSKSLMYQIHIMMFLTEKRLEKRLGAVSPLSFSQFVILMGVTCQHAGMGTQSTLADFLHMTEATISRHIKTLFEAGLLIKEESPANKKIKILKLTDQGANVFKKAEKIIQKELDTIFSPLGPKEQTNLSKNFSILHLSLLSAGVR